MSAKTKFPRTDALAVAKFVCDALKPVTVQLICAGSLRRRKSEVGDVEIVYIPKTVAQPDGLFDTKQVNLVDDALDRLLKDGILARRTNVKGSEIWGPKNKLALHVASGIPVDFFAASEGNWFNYLVCRTGGAENNTLIASAAQRKGWKWNPYGPGFTVLQTSEIVPVRSERDVFDLVGLQYQEPHERR
jgi:DNA polymerase/3'-5' exonuclease PolX